MKTVGKIALDFWTGDQPFVQSLYGAWNDFFARSVERVADEVLSRYDQPDEHLTIESLSLDLGKIGQGDFYEDFPRLLREKLNEALSQLEYSVLSGEAQAAKVSLIDDAYTLLTLFLLHGRIDPLQLARYGDLNDLFLLVVRQSGRRFTAFLRTYGHYTGLQERIVRQFDDESLEVGIRLLQPDEGAFICSYVRFLHRRYQKLERPSITRTGYRYAVWSVVYSYLLGNRSSYFNRKSFLIQTLVSLAARLNITFEYLTGILADEISELPDESATVPELLALLRDINRENLEEEIRRAAFEPKTFYLIIGEGWKQRSGTETEPEIVRSLTGILSHEDSCRTFLMLLKEEEIIRLVPLVIPEESAFVIAYARELERHKEKGAFEGCAGGEFSKLKWMVIFPVLLENRGTAFNRKSFIREVLTRISAHYNLSLKGLVAFLSGKDYIALLDRELAEIFCSLAAELKLEVAPEKHKRQSNIIEDAIALIGQAKKEAVVTGEQKQFLLDILSNDLQRKEIVDHLAEKEQEAILIILLPEEKEYVLIYARILITSAGRHSEISGKTTGGFERLVWFFIFGILTEKTASRFNRRAFARKMLGSLSSHYNLYYADLLTLLYRYSKSVRLPEMIAGVINELYDEERQVWLDHALSVSGEKAKEKLLRNLYPETAGFILEFLNFLEWFFRTGVNDLCSDPEFTGMKDWKALFARFQNDKWKLVFKWIFSSKGKTFDRKDFVRAVLRQICQHYRIDRTLFDKGVRMAMEQMPGKLSANVWVAVYQTLPAHKSKVPRENLTDNLSKNKNEMNNKELFDQNEAIFIGNAGLVLLTPFLPRLFDMLHLTERGSFKNEESQITAIFLMQYAAYGDKQTEFGEHELALNKLLTGILPEKSVPGTCELTEEQRETVISMLKSVLQHWEKLKNTSIEGFQQAFLQREGKLEEKEGYIKLTVDEKAYDMLLDSIPWNFRNIKFPWMEKYIEVKWR